MRSLIAFTSALQLTYESTAAPGWAAMKARELVGRAAVGERAAGLEIGHHHLARGIQDLRRLGHEVDAAEGDHVGFHLLGGLRELERVADEIGEVLDLGFLVVVGQDHGVALALDARDRGFEIVGKVRGGGAGAAAMSQDI